MPQRTFVFIAVVLAVLAIVMNLANMGGDWSFLVISVSLVLVQVGLLTNI